MNKFYPGALISLMLASTPLWGGCGADDGSEVTSDTPVRGAGKADDIEVDCSDAALDQHGICRRTNGQFAPASCCVEVDQCANATIDAQGTCRDTQNGQFVPTACCEALCEGTSLINGFCRHEDSGRFALAACCADICFDLQPPAADDVPPGSCEASCGDIALDGDCFCDSACSQFGDCCADFADECPDEAAEATAPPAPDSCADSCGTAAPGGACFCDEACVSLGDCCADKVAHCGGGGSDAVVACEVDACETAAVDEHGICRKDNGQFALSACCAPVCNNVDLVIEDSELHCLDTESGDDLPMTCCDERCEGAELDRHGICRDSVSGQFADPACCADLCVLAQERGDVEALDGCNGVQQQAPV
jgi:hypothetical protein